jgi:hypothetical protein
MRGTKTTDNYGNAAFFGEMQKLLCVPWSAFAQISYAANRLKQSGPP